MEGSAMFTPKSGSSDRALRILVPTDLSAFGDLALRYALLFREKLGAKLTFLYADEISWLAEEHPIGYYFENVSEAKKALLRRLHDYAAKHSPDVATLFVDDAPETAIVQTARDINADLIIMGTHGRRGIRRAILGSVAEYVLRETDVPVLTVNPSKFRPDAVAGIRTILCPVNFTDVARTALEKASDLAKTFDAQLVVMHVCEGKEPPVSSDVQNEFRAWVNPLVRANTRYSEVVVHGDAAAAVLAVADQIDADLLVIGAKHRRFADTTVAGTTTERITRYAKHAVMTVIRKETAAKAVAA
jgi:nucleotide-binding universal stress UspA family protein